MNLLEFLLLVLVAGLSGTVGQALAGYSAGGCLASIALGFVGALLGSWLAGALGLPLVLTVSVGGQPFPIIWSVVGAALFVALLGLITRPRRPVRHE
jgi:uncharacterized membrane protein YeaQ/YmgE (transglycosylase-associated protein family)